MVSHCPSSRRVRVLHKAGDGYAATQGPQLWVTHSPSVGRPRSPTCVFPSGPRGKWVWGKGAGDTSGAMAEPSASPRPSIPLPQPQSSPSSPYRLHGPMPATSPPLSIRQTQEECSNPQIPSVSCLKPFIGPRLPVSSGLLFTFTPLAQFTFNSKANYKKSCL